VARRWYSNPNKDQVQSRSLHDAVFGEVSRTIKLDYRRIISVVREFHGFLRIYFVAVGHAEVGLD